MMYFKMRGFKVKDQTFGQDVDNDYKKYKKIKRRKKFNIIAFQYTEWEDNVLKDINGYCIEYLTNLIKYIQYKKQNIEISKDSLTSVMIPLFTFIMGIYIAVIPLVSSVMQQADTNIINYYDAILSTVDKELEPIYEEYVQTKKREFIEDTLLNFKDNNLFIFNVSNYFGVSSFIVLITGLSQFRKNVMKIAFYENYIEIIQKVVDNKVQGEESQYKT